MRGGGELLVEALSSDAEALTRGQADFSRFEAGSDYFENSFSGSVWLFLVCRSAFSGSRCCAKSSSIWAEIWMENR
jgi:hypothetical protein